MRILFLALVGVVVFSTHCAYAEKNRTDLTKLECGGIKSEVVTTCIDKRSGLCSSQAWSVQGQSVDLLTEHDLGFHVWSWSCVSTNQGQVIIFGLVNGGNCPDCEVWEIWSPKGKKISDTNSFLKDYKELDAPKGAMKQYQLIKRGRYGRAD